MTAGPGSSADERSHRLRANFALLLMTLIWGINFSVAKDAISRIPPLAFNTLRFPLAAAVVTFALLRAGGLRWPERKDRLPLLALGVIGNLAYQLFFIFGLTGTRAGTASLILAGTPVMTALLGALSGRERVSRRVWLGITATILGIALVVWPAAAGAGGGDSVRGSLLILAATVSWAAYGIGSRDLIRRYGALPVTAWTLWPGTLAIVLAGVPSTVAFGPGTLTIQDWGAIVYAGALSIGVCYMLWSYGVRHLGATRTSAFANVTPVVALVAAWIFLAEQPIAVQLLGAAIIIGGVTLAQLPDRR